MSKHLSHINDEKALEAYFNELFARYEYRLYTLAKKLTKSDQYAKDVIQEVFLKLWEHRQELPAMQHPEAWLYRVTENKVIDFLRKAAADGRLREAIWHLLPGGDNEPAVLTEAREFHQIIQRAIDQLPPQRKLIYQLNREAGLNYQEIAQELKISRHTVKNQLFNAMQSIRRFFEQSAKIFF